MPFSGMLKESRSDKIQHCPPTLGNPLSRQRIISSHDPHYRRAGEIKNDHRNHGRDELQRINLPEVTCGLSRSQDLRDLAEKWTEILFCDALQLPRATAASAHHFALNNARIRRVTR